MTAGTGTFPDRDGGAAGLAGPGVLAGNRQSASPARSHDRDDGQTPQPGFVSAWVNAFTTFDQGHGFAVNLVVVVALAVTGAVFLSGRPRLIGPVLARFTVLCLANWVLVEDLGYLRRPEHPSPTA